MSVTVRLAGEVDLAAVEYVMSRLEPAATRAALAGEDLVIDFSDVTFLDSSGLNVLVRVRRKLPDACALVLVGCTPPVRRVLDVSGLGDLCAD